MKRKTYWWNDEIKMVKNGHINNWKYYVETRTEAKRVVREAKLKAFENFYNELSLKMAT